MSQDKVLASGAVHLTLTDSKGRVKVDSVETNMIVSSGLGFITSRLIGAGTSPVSHIAIGTGVPATTADMTTLVAENSRVAISSATVVSTVVTADSVQYMATFPAGQGTGPITEAGLFNAPSSGTMLARLLFGVITKQAGDALTLVWKIKFSNS